MTGVEDAFGAEIDYAMLVKVYGEPTRARSAIGPLASLAASGWASRVAPIPGTSARLT